MVVLHVLLFIIASFGCCSALTFEELNSWRKPLGKKTLSIKQLNNKQKTIIPLFEHYPLLSQKIPFLSLGTLPTPVIKLDNLGKTLGIKNLYLKNDALSSSPFGGNKIRKLEFLLADALNQKAKTVITVGDAGSNHALATIICAKKLHMKTYSMLTPQLNTSYLHRNLLLSSYYEGNIQYYDSEETRDDAVRDLCASLHKEEGRFPYFIPSGGSCAIGCLGFVNAAFELKKQIDQGLIPEPNVIYMALGSAGTAAGLILGAKLAKIKSKIIPVRISGNIEEKINVLVTLLNKTSLLLHRLAPKCPFIRFTKNDVFIHDDFSGKQYAQITPASAKAIQQLFDNEGIKLEGTYTGKACAALIHDIQHNSDLKDKVVLFWNTFCADPCSDIVNHVDYKQLPKSLYHYFEEPLQALDQGL